MLVAIHRTRSIGLPGIRKNLVNRKREITAAGQVWMVRSLNASPAPERVAHAYAFWPVKSVWCLACPPPIPTPNPTVEAPPRGPRSGP
jgi:hypothetical protein